MDEKSKGQIDVAMAQLARGDRSAFSFLFTSLWPIVLKFSNSILRHPEDASDAAQNAMKKILERASDYDTSKPAIPWALAITGWECRTIQRKRARRNEINDDDLHNLAGDQPSDVVEQRQLLQAALHALGELSPTDQETLQSTYWEASSSVFGATLRKRRERATDRLRATFRRLYGID